MKINKRNVIKTPERKKPKTKIKKKESQIEEPKQEQSLYDTLTLEQKVKLAMYKPTKINFRTFNQDLANGKI